MSLPIYFQVRQGLGKPHVAVFFQNLFYVTILLKMEIHAENVNHASYSLRKNISVIEN